MTFKLHNFPHVASQGSELTLTTSPLPQRLPVPLIQLPASILCTHTKWLIFIRTRVSVTHLDVIAILSFLTNRQVKFQWPCELVRRVHWLHTQQDHVATILHNVHNNTAHKKYRSCTIISNNLATKRDFEGHYRVLAFCAVMRGFCYNHSFCTK